MNTFVQFFQKVSLLVLTPQCYQVFFTDLDFFNGACLKSTLSKGLGLGIVGGSLLVKLPQVIKLWKNKSAKGISIMNVSMDLYAVTANVVYSYANKFPFSAWGDSLFILFQTLLIVMLVINYNVSRNAAKSFTAVFCVLFSVLMSGAVPESVLWTAQLTSIPLMFFGKITQSYVNYVNKGTGQLSMATCILLFLGAAVRVFTSVQETGDSLLIWTFTLATIANFIIVAQFYYYRPIATKVKSSKKKTKKT
ncbi:mannose-P-dolichol utilization defect 1 protein homolog [Adelges cooleyi]|uniref:mannose-P-dolichol utilization defect 1 protein homolog n=1 Tax=Adelges cooleyi TaxID=133065 RepID=UPI0021800D69|nr:mannose-P-dolichol utilization defect 1 protein homolog [Adelges cooleyi]